MKKITKAEYQKKFQKRTLLEAKKRRLREARLSKDQARATLVIPKRSPGQEAACAFLVRKRTKE